MDELTNVIGKVENGKQVVLTSYLTGSKQLAEDFLQLLLDLVVEGQLDAKGLVSCFAGRNPKERNPQQVLQIVIFLFLGRCSV